MKYKLDNLIYNTSDPVKAEKLEGLGAIQIEGGTEEVKEKTIPTGANLQNLKVDDLKALLDEKEIEYDQKATKAELIELLK